MLCVTHDQVVAFLGESLNPEQRQAIEHHLDTCAECLELMTLVGKTSLARGSAQRDIIPRDTANASDDPTENYRDLVPVDPQHYVIGHEIARGGIGRIIAARDRRLGRHVAIKELLIESQALRARFEREARITAKLQHPAIVNLLEAGTWPSGEPFYVMKLVTGVSLDEVITRHPTLHARLSLLPNVIAAVDALAYAHSVHVIHRDLKPANVLVGEFGETVVIDWGFAKDLADTNGAPEVAGDRHRMAGFPGATLDGSIIGTPAYMPAEQARGGGVDERADVHALGAILYHLLAGVPPYTGNTHDAILGAVIAGPPKPIDTVVVGVPPDLITIVNKAMARAAEDRYPTAKELAEDLKRFQTGQLVGAHRYSTWQLLRRWIRRHRATLAVAAVATLVLAVLGVAGLQRIFREQTRAEEQRQIAEQSRNEAEDLMGFMLTDMTKKVRPLGRLDVLDDIAKKAAAYYARRPVDGSKVELAKRARARINLGDVLAAQGHADAALKEYRAALALYQILQATDPMNADRVQATATSHAKIGHTLQTQGDANGALVEYRAAVTIGELAVKPSSGGTSQRTVAISQGAIGDIMLAQGDPKGALAKYRATLAIAQALATGKPADRDAQGFLLAARLDVGKVLVVLGDFAPALAEFQSALAIAETLAKDPTNADAQRYLWTTHTLLGDVFSAQGDYKRDLAEFRGALAIAETLATKDSTNANRQHELSILHQRLGAKLDARGDRVRALAEFTAALTIDERLVAKDSTNTEYQQQLAKSHLQCAVEYAAQGNRTRALAENRAGLAIVERLVAKDPKNAEWQNLLAGGQAQLGEVLLDQGDTVEALAALRAAVAGFDAVVAKDPSSASQQRDAATSREKLGDALAARGDQAAALAEYRAALKITDALADKNRLDGIGQARRASSHINIGEMLVAQENANGALVEYRAALAILEVLAAKDPTNADGQVLRSKARGNIGDVLLARRDAEGALAEYRAALAIAVAQAAKDPTNLDRQKDLALDHGRVGDALLARGDKLGGRAESRAGLAVARRLQTTYPKRADVQKIVASLTAKASGRGTAAAHHPR